MSPKERLTFIFLLALWLASVAIFWFWWLRVERGIGDIGYLINSSIMFWTTVVPGYFVVIFARARVPDRSLPISQNWRVAMVVTKAPSEPFRILKRTLLAMIAQRYSHDTWLADEDPSNEVLSWCREHNVRVSTRRNISEYHRASWPRRTKCKEGNLAYFYDKHGYGMYDIVVQLDADHVPTPGYLEEMLRPFSDPRVGYVSAPSICDSNGAESWAARGRLHAEGALHGALQAGHNGGLAPLCIGSHYAVRTAALEEIGGLGPELAEDHSTTLMMNAAGWRGVHALDAIAHGDGPLTFVDMITQEFQWSRSLVTVLLRYSPKHIPSMPLRIKAQFLFSQLWYPLFASAMLAIYLLPLIALAKGSSFADISYAEFFIRAALVTGSILAVMCWIRNRGWARPAEAKVLSWEGAVFLLARWPWALLGTTAALVDWARGRESGFRITPKGASGGSLPFAATCPYAALSIASAVAAMLVRDAGSAQGFYLFALVNSAVYLCVFLTIVIQHHRERRAADGEPRELPGAFRGLELAGASLALLALVCGASLRAGAGVEGLLWGADALVPAAAVAGAGRARRVNLGVYDPERSFGRTNEIAVEHVFVSWLEDNEARIVSAFQYARERDRWLMITVEPWTNRPKPDGRDLLRDIVVGRYDLRIDKVCKDIAALDAPVFLRWGHEMETPTGRYPWAQHHPGSYVRAYRHFVDRCRQHATRLLYVWSPRGDHGLDLYFPGKDSVDYVGLSVFSLPEWELDYYGRTRKFAENFGEKYERVKKYDKPVMIAELGIGGTMPYRDSWLKEALGVMDDFDLLRTTMYFNAKDSLNAWEEKYAIPDWRIPVGFLVKGSGHR